MNLPEVDHGQSVAVQAELRVRTESTLWVLQPARYMRLPVDDLPRVWLPSLEDRLADNRWHAHRGIVWHKGTRGLRMRLFPEAGWFEGCVGIETGIIVELGGI